MNNKSGSERGEVEVNDIMQALARGYCSKENESKVLDATLIQAMAIEVMPLIAGLQKLCEEQKAELESKRHETHCCCGNPHLSENTAVKLLQAKLEEQKGERDEANNAYQAQSQRLHDLESQLATQTERVKELEGVLTDLKRHNNHTIEEEMWRIDQALKQESLGDGK